MRNISFVFILAILSIPALKAQETPPADEKYYTSESSEAPTIQKLRIKKEAEKQMERVKILSRWYIGADLFGRSDITSLDNNYRYLFKSSFASTIDFSFSGQVGWIFREQLAVEGGYAHSKIHNTAFLNTTNKGGFKFSNDGNAFFLRTKFLLEFGQMGLRRPGLWIGGGVWSAPNSGGERDPRGYMITHYNNMGAADTTYISSKTTIGNQWTYGLEASVEYAFKVSEWSDAAIFIRRHWGYGTAISTELTFADNKKVNDTGFLKSDGTGWNFGISFRFMTGIRRGELKTHSPGNAGPSPYRSRVEP